MTLYLDPTGHADCCACAGCEALMQEGDPNQPSPALTEWTYTMDLSQTSFDSSRYNLAEFEQAVRDAFATWSSIANISFTEVASNGTIDVKTTSEGDFNDSTWGAPGGTIGYGGGFPRIAWQDAAETWSPYGGGGISYFLVATHEIGHALGLSHNSNGAQVMNPSLGSQKGIYAGDIEALIARFGAREWTDDSEEIFMTYVQVGQTVEAKGGNDMIMATVKADTIYGGAGNDTIEGNDGNDQIFDTLGQNTIKAGNNNDVVVGGSGKTDAEGGSGADIIIGGKGDDELDGGNGDDTIRGDAQSSFFHGDDKITAGKGTDFVEGGGGSDTFVFRPSDGTNTIATLNISGTNPSGTSAAGADFESGVDVIDLSAFGYSSRAEAFANVTNSGGNARFSDQGTVIIFYDLNLSDLSQNDFLV